MKLFHLKSTFVIFLLFLNTFNINYAYGSLSGMGEVSKGMNEEEAKQQEQQLRKQEQLLREQEFEMNAIRLRQLQQEEQQRNQERLNANILNNWAAQVNKISPKMIDNDTRLDGAVVDSGRLIYIYTLVSLKAQQITPEIKANFGNNLRRTVCNDSNLRQGLNLGYGVSHSYRDFNGINVVEYTTYLRDCN